MTTQQALEASPTESPPLGGRVLVVEDDPVLLTVLTRILQKWGCTTLQAKDGQDALEAIDSNVEKLSVVLLDMMLPLVSGLEVARWVHAECPELPIVACSAALTHDLMADLQEVGVREFLPKPFSPDELRLTLIRAARSIDENEGELS